MNNLIDPTEFKISAADFWRQACTTDFQSVYAIGSFSGQQFCLEVRRNQTVIRKADLHVYLAGNTHCFVEDSALLELLFPSDLTAQPQLKLRDGRTVGLFHCDMEDVGLFQGLAGQMRTEFSMALLSEYAYNNAYFMALELQLACRKAVRETYEQAQQHDRPELYMPRFDPLESFYGKLMNLAWDFKPPHFASRERERQFEVPQVLFGSLLRLMNEYSRLLKVGLADRAGTTFCERIHEVLRALVRCISGHDIGALLPERAVTKGTDNMRG